MKRITIQILITLSSLSCMGHQYTGRLLTAEGCLQSNTTGATPAQIKDAVAALIVEFEQEDGTTMWSICSATSIGPRVFLTAAHCVRRDNIRLEIRQGPEVYSYDMDGNPKWKTYEVSHYTRHRLSLTPGEALPLHDLALVYTQQLWEGSSLRVNTTTVPRVGIEIQTAGYGISALDSKDAGSLRSGLDEVSEVSNLWLRTSGAPHTSVGLSGDSGGPAIYKGEVIGVLSTRNDELENAYTLTSAHKGYIHEDCAKF